jgi:hypothetical protein
VIKVCHGVRQSFQADAGMIHHPDPFQLIVCLFSCHPTVYRLSHSPVRERTVRCTNSNGFGLYEAVSE